MDPCYASWADWIESAWQRDRPVTVLDLCCGTGLMTAELLTRGLQVTGVDASPAMLSLARVRLGTGVPLVEAWLPDLPVDGPFDAVVSTLDGFNYLTWDDLAETFATAANALRPGGWMLFDVLGPGSLDFARAHPVITGGRDGSTFTLTTQVSGATCTATLDFQSTDPSLTSFVETHVQHVHTTEEIGEALASAGFSVHRLVDEYSDAAVTDTTLRATWVARREMT